MEWLVDEGETWTSRYEMDNEVALSALGVQAPEIYLTKYMLCRKGYASYNGINLFLHLQMTKVNVHCIYMAKNKNFQTL